MIQKLLDLYEEHRVLLENAATLIGTLGVTSGLGFAYWLAAAQFYTQSEVGFASAATSAMMLLGTIGMMGLGTLMMGELPRREAGRDTLITTGLIVASVAGLILGVGYALFSPIISEEFDVLAATPLNIMIFAVGVVLTSMVLVLDQILLALLKGRMQLWRNAFFAASKLVFVVMTGMWLSEKTGLSIYVTWALGNVASIAFLLVLLGWKRVHSYVTHPDWSLLGDLRREALTHHTLNLAIQAPGFALPVVVTALFSTNVTGSFYVAWLIASFTFIIPAALTMMLFVEGARDPSVMVEKLRFTLRVSIILACVTTIFFVVGAPYILGIFGEAYANDASASLQLMTLAVFPIIVRVHYVAISQVYKRVAPAALLMIIGAGIEIVLAIMGGLYGGVEGLVIGWLAGVLLEAIITAPMVYRTARGHIPVQKSKLMDTENDSTAPVSV